MPEPTKPAHLGPDGQPDMCIAEAVRHGPAVHMDLWYPGCPGNATHVHLGLMDVRAADDLRISYDFKRDGWVVEQDFNSHVSDRECAEDWREVGFFRPWPGEKEDAPPS